MSNGKNELNEFIVCGCAMNFGIVFLVKHTVILSHTTNIRI